MFAPTYKGRDIDRRIARITGKDRKATIHENKCMTCDSVVDTFKDALSEKEYTISGMCQECQDAVWDK
jgi:hypothetical protein|tara:strand:+ start:356 stop:559 length:204 start_codon:yes stop_codon:yes gene_type:complete